MSYPTIWKNSRRTPAEQWVGLGIISLCAWGFAVLTIYFLEQDRGWISTLFYPWGSISIAWQECAFPMMHSFSALAFWSLWRRHSLRGLKLELCLFLTMFFLEAGWTASLYALREMPLSLILLLLWMSAALAATALYWKKEKLAGRFQLLPLSWIFYLIIVNMVLCIANP